MSGSEEDDNYEYSHSENEDDNNEESFAKLQASVAQLDSSQKVRAAKRNELGSLISEYHVNESGKAVVATQELANVLGSKKKGLKILKRVKNVGSKSKTLAKPLSKPIVEQIKRKIGYAVVKQQLSSWEPVVESHRVADHLVFPLNAPTFSINDGSYLSRHVVPTQLEKELNAVLHGEQPKKAETIEEDEFPLTLDELIERRKELATIRARQSYKEAKAFRQSKIKSKKYHRIQKREKVKQQLKEFEILQKTDPAAALKKLEELEKSRAEERATLRHKSTGKWAKNLVVRAKYDKDTRKALAEQLAVSRDITQKAKTVDSSDDEADPVTPAVLETALNIAKSNPWSLEVTSDVNSFISGFRKYWGEKGQSVEENMADTEKTVEEPVIAEIERQPKVQTKNKLKTRTPGKWAVTPVVPDSSPLKRKVVNMDIDEAFYVADQKLAKRISEKFKILEGKIKPVPKKNIKRINKTAELPDLKMKKSRWHVDRPKIDQELGDTTQENNTSALATSSAASLGSKAVASEKESNPYDLNIDPDKFMKVKSRNVETPAGEDVTEGDMDAVDDDEERQKVIMEAFADDNVIDFREAKNKEENVTKPVVVKELPGWGSWGGDGVVASKRRRRRFLQVPQLPDRKDKRLTDVIINENANPKVQDHMVKEIPFPFKSVAAFESNIRAPVSRDWVPELAHQELIRPAVVTRQGTIIEPMSDQLLLRNKPKAKSVFKSKTKAVK